MQQGSKETLCNNESEEHVHKHGYTLPHGPSISQGVPNTMQKMPQLCKPWPPKIWSFGFGPGPEFTSRMHLVIGFFGSLLHSSSPSPIKLIRICYIHSSFFLLSKPHIGDTLPLYKVVLCVLQALLNPSMLGFDLKLQPTISKLFSSLLINFPSFPLLSIKVLKFYLN